jgi:hypothetical protein
MHFRSIFSLTCMFSLGGERDFIRGIPWDEKLEGKMMFTAEVDGNMGNRFRFS